jgi:hypothetical protein
MPKILEIFCIKDYFDFRSALDSFRLIQDI